MRTAERRNRGACWRLPRCDRPLQLRAPGTGAGRGEAAELLGLARHARERSRAYGNTLLDARCRRHRSGATHHRRNTNFRRTRWVLEELRQLRSSCIAQWCRWRQPVPRAGISARTASTVVGGLHECIASVFLPFSTQRPRSWWRGTGDGVGIDPTSPVGSRTCWSGTLIGRGACCGCRSWISFALGAFPCRSFEARATR